MLEEQKYLQSKIRHSVIIPVFNEELNLEPLCMRLTRVMQDIGGDYEIIFVDDGSTDGSFQVLQRLHKADSKVKVIRFTRNFGQHIAITAGLDSCKGETAVLMDADLKDLPEEIPKLLSKLKEGYEIVYGCREGRRDSLFRRTASRIYLWLLAKLTNQTISADITSFRVMTRRVVDYMNQFRERCRFYGGLVAWLGFPYGIVEVEQGKRAAGETKYDLWKMIKLAIEGVISFSDIPLRLIGYFGFIISGISFVMGFYFLVIWLVWRTPPPGYTSIVVSLFFTGGVILIVLGVIGRYIGGIYTETKKRPLYVIRDMIE
jgi:dolichol-phosphate mannosyltransferase